MDTGLYQGVAAMRTTEKRLETITANIANIGAHGFKRQAAVTRSFVVGEGDRKHVEIATQHATDFTQGEIAQTGNQFDLALDGPGFFALETQRGRSYTRDGTFRLDDQGRLLSNDGFPVAWDGAPGQLRATGEAVTIDGSGAVRQGEASIGRLRVVDFKNAQLLEEDAYGNWRAPGGQRELPATCIVHQGSIERSNVNAMDELVEMVMAQRRFENSTTVMRSIDQTYKRLNQPHS